MGEAFINGVYGATGASQARARTGAIFEAPRLRLPQRVAHLEIYTSYLVPACRGEDRRGPLETVA